MIFAPRSCPSNPGLAITTRIRPPGTWAEYRGAPDGHWRMSRAATGAAAVVFVLVATAVQLWRLADENVFGTV